MTTVSISTVQTLDDVKSFFRELNNLFDLAWVPYDDFVDGFFNKAGETYDKVEGERLNKLMDEAHDVCEAADVDIAEIGLEVNKPLRTKYGIGTDYED